MEDRKSPSNRDDRPESSSPSTQREEEQVIKPTQELEITLEEPLAKRRLTWFK